MLYSSAGLLALIIHLIINHGILWNPSAHEDLPAYRPYRGYLLIVAAYFVTDIMWGILYERGLIMLTFIDTELYFVAMAGSILLWTRYVAVYLQQRNSFSRTLTTIGWVIFVFQVVVTALNLFVPVLFSFDDQGVYHAELTRYITLICQIAMYFMVAAYALSVSLRSSGTKRQRHRIIGLASLAMIGFVIAQTTLPLMPMYSIGCLLCCCLLHSFVLEDEKDEHHSVLEEQLRENILKGNYYDLLTGLQGMTHFFDVAQKRRKQIVRRGGKCAFLYLNLNGIKFYNHEYGFEEGDRLRRDLAQLLIASFGKDNCCRLGQDHFAVITREDGLEDKLERLFEEWGRRDDSVSPAILVGVYPDRMEQVSISAACDRAKIACDSIRRSYVCATNYFDESMLDGARRHQYIVSHLDEAIKKGWIQVFYQPIVRAISGHVCDEEALARWIDPNLGMLSPAEFIPVLEEANLIYKVDLYVVEQVLEKIAFMQSRGFPRVAQSINLSRSDFDTCDIVEEVRRRVDEAGLPHELLSVEITESIIGTDFDYIKTQIDRFRDLGFPVWMDDFGSGYSSLDVLQKIQVDLLKFDMRFMQQFDHGDRSRIILTELMKMAVALGVDTLCEGVERTDQEHFLREIGCSKLQGYLYTKPIPLDDVLRRYEDGVQIGFENPEESSYFEAIGQVNLYDLAVISNEDEDADGMRHYFNTVPMAIIETRGEFVRFMRTNPSYRDFMSRTFGVSLSGLDVSFEERPAVEGVAFVSMVKRCCEAGGRAMFDEILPDGSLVHAFIRYIATDPLTNATAAAVAILTISDVHGSDVGTRA